MDSCLCGLEPSSKPSFWLKWHRCELIRFDIILKLTNHSSGFLLLAVNTIGKEHNAVDSLYQILLIWTCLARVSILSPPSCSKFLSYLTGWITVISWQSGLASTAFLGATIIQGLLVLNNPSYSPQRWHATLLFYAIITACLFTNTYLARILPQIESTILLLHVLGFFGILVPLVYLAPHSSPSAVFTAFNNGGGWSTDGLSFFVGLSSSIFSFIGDSFGSVPWEITS